MAVTFLNGFRTNPGRLADHLASTAEAIGHLRRLDVQAFDMQPLTGTDVGTIVSATTHADNADWATSMQQVLADEGWQDFWGRVTSNPSAEQVESSLFADIDPTFEPATDRPLGVVSAFQWRPYPGRMVEFIGNIETATGHIERLGGYTRSMQSVIGANPLTMLVSIGHADLDSYGEFADKSQADEQFQAFWGEVMMNPSAELIRSGVYLNIS